MREMRGLPAEASGETLREGLRRRGYLLLRGLLPGVEVADAAARLTAVLVNNGWLRDTEAGLSRRVGRRGVRRREVDAVYRVLQSCEAVHRLMCHPAIRRAVESLIGPAVAHPQRIIRTTFPVQVGGPSSPAVHRDYPAWRIVDMLTVWLPLLPCPPERGALCVLEASHRDGMACPTDLVGPRWAAAAFEPGDVLLMHCYTVHGALPNTSGYLRLSVDSRWQSLDAPVPDSVRRPDRGEDWAEYTTGWSSTEWIDLPSCARVVDDAEWAWDELESLPDSPLLSNSTAAR